MNRKYQNPNPGQKFLKSKYHQVQKSPATVTSRKIMLTDLCQQQKLKVGELIKINQQRKQQIHLLNEQIAKLKLQLQQISQKNKQETFKLHEELKSFKDNKDLEKRFQEEVSKYEEHILNIQILNKDLAMQNQVLKEKIKAVTEIQKYNKSIQTDEVSQSHNGCQTKKIKKRNQGVQIDMDFYEENQRTFSRQKRSKSHSKLIKKSMTKSQLDGSVKDSSKAHEISYDQSLKSNNKNDENIEGCLNELTRQLLSIKEKKLSHLKYSLEASKAQLKKKEFTQIQEEPQQFIFQNLLNEKVNTEQQEIDDNELNKMLKSKNFSASKLLTVKGLLNQSHGSNKRYLQSKNLNNSKNDGRQHFAPFNYEIKKQNEGKSLSKKSTLTLNQKKQNKNVNAFDSDLLDLVDSMNK